MFIFLLAVDVKWLHVPPDVERGTVRDGLIAIEYFITNKTIIVELL